MILASRNVEEFELYLSALAEAKRAYIRKKVRDLNARSSAGEHPLTVLLQAELAQVLSHTPVVPSTPVGLPMATDF